MRDHISKQRSIARHIIDGAITIDSIPEFQNMLKIFPDNPALHTAFADLLLKKGHQNEAAGWYFKASDLCFDTGMMLSAILNSVSAWRIIKPTNQKARQFFDRLKNTSFEAAPLVTFFTDLSYPEFVAFTNRLARIRLSAGKVIKKIGDIESDLFLIASGTVRDTIYQPLNKDETQHRKSSVYLGENDIFGNVFPFEEESLSQSYLETISGVEVGRISKSKLVEVCKKFPNVAQSMIRLFESRQALLKHQKHRYVRKSDRHALPVRMHLELIPEGAGDDAPYLLQGFSRDISVGGVCIVLDQKYAKLASYFETIGNAKIEISLPSDAFTLKVSGKVIWCKSVLMEGDKTLALGIQFKDMTPKMSGMLVMFAELLHKEERD